MIGRLVRGAMNLAGPTEYSVQTRWTIFVSFEWLLPRTRFRATESGVDRRVFGVVTVVSTLISVVSELAVAVPGFKSARFACTVVATG